MKFVNLFFENGFKEYKSSIKKSIIAFISLVLIVFAYFIFYYKINIVIEKEGEVIFQNYREIYANQDGYIDVINVKEGDYLQEGNLLFEINNYKLTNKLIDIDRRYNEALNSLKNNNQYYTGFNQVNYNKFLIKNLLLEKENISKELCKLKIIAPFNGYISGIDLQKLQGKSVKRGDFICHFYNKKNTFVRIKVDSREINRIDLDNLVLVRPLIDDSEEIVSKIIKLYEIPLFNENKKSYYIDIALNEQYQYKSGTRTICKIITEESSMKDIFLNKILSI